jgi:hypothetical protein
MGGSPSLQCGCQNEKDKRFMINPWGDAASVKFEDDKGDWESIPKRVEKDNIYSAIFNDRPFGITFESRLTAAGELADKSQEKKCFLHNVTNLAGVAAKAGIAPFSKIIQVNGKPCDYKMHSAVVEMFKTSKLPCKVTFRNPSPFLSNYVAFDEQEKCLDICEV